MKSGCRIEARQLATGERLQRCLTLYSVIAWRVFYATMLARAVPDMPCSVLLEIEEWQALYCAIHHCPRRLQSHPRWARRCAGLHSSAALWAAASVTHPGAETLWRGFQHLSDLTRMYCIMRPAPP